MSAAATPPPRPLRIQLIAQDNGFGLSRDLDLLAQTIRSLGHEVATLPLAAIDEALRWKLGRGWRAQRSQWQGALQQVLGRARFDLNVMFEHVWPAQFGLARRQIALPNPEWFDAKDSRHLHRMDGIWAKTQQTARLFASARRPVHYIGFSSEDCLDPGVPRQPGFFHLAGGSPRKGTAALLNLWRRHPEWPTLTVVQRQPMAAPLPANIEMHHGYLALAELRRLQNRHLIHLCPSEAEGYGHYLVEAMSVGAVVVTTDAAPMNELVHPDRGWLVAATRGAAMGMDHAHHVQPAALESVIETLRRLEPAQLAAIGQRGRAWFESNRQQFPQRVAAALASQD